MNDQLFGGLLILFGLVIGGIALGAQNAEVRAAEEEGRAPSSFPSMIAAIGGGMILAGLVLAFGLISTNKE